MLVSTWIDRWAAYNRGNCHVVPMEKPHVVRYRFRHSRVTLSKRFKTDAQMQSYIDQHRTIRDKDNKVVQVGDWIWFECLLDNVLVSNH